MEKEQSLVNVKKKQLVTIFDIDGKFFQKDINDVKAVLPPLFEYELNAKENNEEEINCIKLSDVNEDHHHLLTRATLKSVFALHDVLKLRPKTLDRQQRKKLESANDFFIIGDYFGINSELIDHLKFLTTRYCKPEGLSPLLKHSKYRYSTLELFEQGLLTKDDVLLPFDNTIDIDLTHLNISSKEFLACIPFLLTKKEPECFRSNYQMELLYKTTSDYEGKTLLNRSITPFETYQKFKAANIIEEQDGDSYFNFSKLNIHTLEELSNFIKKLQSHHTSCLNLSNLNICSLNEYEELIKHLKLSRAEFDRISSINLNNNQLEELPPLFLKQTYPNLIRVTAKHNQIKRVMLMTNPDFRCQKILLALENIHLNLAHNQLRQLPRITKHTSKAIGFRSIHEKRFAHFASINLKDNPLSLKTRSLIRNQNYPLFDFSKKCLFYGIAQTIQLFPTIRLGYYLADCIRLKTILTNPTIARNVYKKHLVPNGGAYTNMAFFYTRLSDIFINHHLFFLGHYLHLKKTPSTITYDKKNMVHEIIEEIFSELKQELLDVHLNQTPYHRIYKVWNVLNISSEVYG